MHFHLVYSSVDDGPKVGYYYITTVLSTIKGA